MLNPHRLNELAGHTTIEPNYPLSWTRGGAIYVALAWQNRNIDEEQLKMVKQMGWNLDIPIAFPATYQDQRMIAQRSCFTIHGLSLKPLTDIILQNDGEVKKYLIEYTINSSSRKQMIQELSILGISATTIFPDLDHLSEDLIRDIRK